MLTYTSICLEPFVSQMERQHTGGTQDELYVEWQRERKASGGHQVQKDCHSQVASVHSPDALRQER